MPQQHARISLENLPVPLKLENIIINYKITVMNRVKVRQ